MENVKKFLFAIVLLGVIAAVWVVSTFVFQSKDTSIADGAEAYTVQIAKSFEMEELDKVYEREEKSFPVLPQEFLNLVEKN